MKSLKSFNLPKGWGMGPDQWWLSPFGAIYHAEEKMAVVADLHLGYTEARGRNGDSIPAFHDSAEIKTLARLLESVAIEKIVIAGDLLESPKTSIGEHSVLSLFTDWLKDRQITPVMIAGNHDPANDRRFVTSYDVHHWRIHHGHSNYPLNQGRKQITGHLHPTIRFEARCFKAFLVSETHIILPAFSHNAAGVNYLAEQNQSALPVGDYQTWLCSQNRTLNFGPLSSLGTHIR